MSLDTLESNSKKNTGISINNGNIAGNINGILDGDITLKETEDGIEFLLGDRKVGIVLFDKVEQHIQFVGTINGNVSRIDDGFIQGNFIDHFSEDKGNKIPGIGYEILKLFFEELNKQEDEYEISICIFNPQIKVLVDKLKSEGVIGNIILLEPKRNLYLIEK